MGGGSGGGSGSSLGGQGGDGAGSVRYTEVATTFNLPADYIAAFQAAIYEEINAQLARKMEDYHGLSRRIGSYPPAITAKTAQVSGAGKGAQPKAPLCDCAPARKSRMLVVRKAGRNQGRAFFKCAGSKCDFFAWVDALRPGGGSSGGYDASSDGSGQGPRGSDAFAAARTCMRARERVLRSNDVAFYGSTSLVKEAGVSLGRAFVAGSAYLLLEQAEAAAAFSKGDVWLISRSGEFPPDGTYFGVSTFYSPSSESQLELRFEGSQPPFVGRSRVYAIRGPNAQSLWSMLEVLAQPKLRHMPILPALLQPAEAPAPPATAVSRGGDSLFVLKLEPSEIAALMRRYVDEYSLNAGQVQVFEAVLGMFEAEDDDGVRSAALPGRAATGCSLVLVHGVFGSGKSFTLSVLIMFLVELFEAAQVSRKLRILISAATNVAVDRVLVTLLELGFESFSRVGSVRKIAKPILPHVYRLKAGASARSDAEYEADLKYMLKTAESGAERALIADALAQFKSGASSRVAAKLKTAPVFGTTCLSAFKKEFDGTMFPLIFLDEASQMLEPMSLLPLFRAQGAKLVLVGDPKQLPPTLTTEAASPAAPGLGRSLFDRAVAAGVTPVMLNTQYRCHPTISRICNTLFYGSSLADGVTADDRARLHPALPTLMFVDVFRGRDRLEGKSFSNSEEVAVVLATVRDLVSEFGVAAADIGVIALYRVQVERLKAAAKADEAGAFSELQISSVDAFQGAEKQVIVLSTVSSSMRSFIESPNRLNVALSRARHHLIVVGNGAALARSSLWNYVQQVAMDSDAGFVRVGAVDTFSLARHLDVAATGGE